jgi:hypothetical protein
VGGGTSADLGDTSQEKYNSVNELSDTPWMAASVESFWHSAGKVTTDILAVIYGRQRLRHLEACVSGNEIPGTDRMLLP